jgi:hypothetical protein
MDRVDCAYLINTTPKYFYLLPLHLALLHRYAPNLKWPIYLATEAPELLPPLEHPNLIILELPMTASGFLESRETATQLLPMNIKYVFPMQEDFLLEGRPMEKEIAAAFSALCQDDSSGQAVHSVRLMPCPGPKSKRKYIGSSSTSTSSTLEELDFQLEMVFTYQATLWERTIYKTFMTTLLHKLQGLSQKEKNRMAISVNIAEIQEGQAILKSLSDGKHLSVPREYSHPNAVYLSAWPYRPTAVVRGSLEPWAIELAGREGLPLNR